ncbi:MAG TPA: glucose 1-dehydrogenase [Candidatus Methylomirabilis sp.]|nr:glucose 1-dehydrogenase [Candidatus Methylomirabilis sp.]HSC70811.1 glucose 1-dehydrogenase [Candidatus Methylomirabilis sp.]
MASKRRLEGKVAIVTGAGSRAAGIGNGRAAAILFAREGAKVLLVDNQQAAAQETLAAIKEAGGEAEVFVGDVSTAADCRVMVERVVSRWKRLDILENNVGIEGPGSVVSVPEDEWDRVMTVNVKSMMLTGKFAVPAMAAGGGGSIVNISSISALRPRGLTPYSTSKGAVIALTRAMAIDHARQGIRVNCIAPGPMYTPMAYSAGMSEEARESRRRASPLGIEGTGWDIGYAALFLASDEARYITGVVLTVDGGVTLASPPRGYERSPS